MSVAPENSVITDFLLATTAIDDFSMKTPPVAATGASPGASGEVIERAHSIPEIRAMARK
jgi:hypothetical protein